MPVITITGLIGSGAPELGSEISRKLGLDYVDRLILGTAARHLGATVEALHQREERLPTRGERFSAMLQRLLEPRLLSLKWQKSVIKSHLLRLRLRRRLGHLLRRLIKSGLLR